MQLASGVEIPDGLLAAMTQLAENSRQGFGAWSGTVHQGFEVAISSTPLGMIGPLYDTRVESRYTGKERDAESGLDYFGARYYGSSMGRFQSPDEPFVDQNTADPQSWNLYSYVRNNPLSNTDDDGRSVTVCDNNGQCNTVSNEQYQQAQQGNNGGLNVPTLDQVGTNGSGNITDSNGNKVGSATYVSDGNLDYYANAAGYQQLAGASRVVNAVAGTEMQIMAPWAASAAQCTMAGSTAGGCAANMALSILPEVAELKAGGTVLKEMNLLGKKGAELIQKAGGAAEAAKEFEALKGTEQVLGTTRVKTLSDGSKAVLYNSTGGSGAATIAIQHAEGGVTKIRY